MQSKPANQSLKTRNIRMAQKPKLGGFPPNNPVIYKRRADNKPKPIAKRSPTIEAKPMVADESIAPSVMASNSHFAQPSKLDVASIACVILANPPNVTKINDALVRLAKDDGLAITTVSISPDAAVAAQYEADIVLVNSEFNPKKPIKAAELALYNTKCEYIAIVRSIAAVKLLQAAVTLLKNNQWWLTVLDTESGVIYDQSYIVARNRIFNGKTINTEVWNLLSQTINLSDKAIALST